MNKVVFLDRDGTINVDHGYVYRIADWEFAPGAIEGLKILQQSGYVLAVITNQSGIAHGLYSEKDMRQLHEYMQHELKKAGVELGAVAFCPHGRDSTCECRKPGIGMAKHIEAVLGPIDYAASWTVGDKEADVGFGSTLGTSTALLRSQYWNEADLKIKPTVEVASLLEAAQYIVK